MLNNIISNVKQFREQIYQALTYRCDACMDLLDALCSNIYADTPVKLSLNPLHRRTYNSITDVLSEFHKGGEPQNNKILDALIQQSLKSNQGRDYYLLATDCTPAPRVHSNTLPDRSIIYSPNPIAENKPITIGHKYSITGFLPPKNNNSSPWILPLITERVATNTSDVLLGAKQVQQCLDAIKEKEPNKLFVNVVDSGYCTPEYIDALHSQDARNPNLVTIVRARSNRVVWRKSREKHSKYVGKRGHELWYGDKFDFKDSNTWHAADHSSEETVTTRSGKKCLVQIQSWDEMVMRQKRGIAMNNHTFTLYRVTIADLEGKQIFHKPMWLMVFGSRRNNLTPSEVYYSYLQRYDIEHFFKFDKNHLLADKLQTPDLQHEENWWSICSLAYATLFVSRLAVGKIPYPWEKYLPEIRSTAKKASPTHVQRSFHKLTCTIGTPAASPKVRGKPLGRTFGEKQVKRERRLVVIKRQNTAEKAAA